MLEEEVLAVMRCLKKARLFLLDCPDFTQATDHKPLIRIFKGKELKDIMNLHILNH